MYVACDTNSLKAPNNNYNDNYLLVLITINTATQNEY